MGDHVVQMTESEAREQRRLPLYRAVGIGSCLGSGLLVAWAFGPVIVQGLALGLGGLFVVLALLELALSGGTR